MNVEKFNTLSALVKEFRERDSAAFKKMEEAKAEWKVINEELGSARKTLDAYVALSVQEATQ